MPRPRKGRAAIEKKAQQLSRLTVEYVPVSSIQPNQYNPNRQSDHDFHLLILSMREDGFTQPIIAQRQTREIIDGEHRWTGVIVDHYLRQHNIEPTREACKEARAKRLEILDPGLEIPVVFTDMTPEQMRIATLRHNRARGSEDIDLVSDVLRDLRELGALEWAQDSLLMDDLEMQRLLDDISAPEALKNEEYGGAWDVGVNSEDMAVTTPQGGETARQSVTPAAREQLRQAEEKARVAQSQEDKVKAMSEAKVYRVVAVFANEEASIVRQALGDSPAARILELCQREVEAQTHGGAE